MIVSMTYPSSQWTAAAMALAVALPLHAQTHLPVTIPETEIRTITSRETGHRYDLYVYKPARITRDGARKYPVLYLLDGQWDFKLLASIQGGLFYDRYVPDVIIVGITYSGPRANYDSLRAVDYTPVASPANPNSGGGTRFLAFLERELIPFVESEYPADPARRGLMGNSLGGLLALHALLTKPGLFAGYVAGSPAVTYASGAAFAAESAYARGNNALPARLFVAVGSDEPLAAPVQAYVRTLQARKHRGFVLESRVIAEERHAGNKPDGLNRGMRFLFRDTTAAAQSRSAVTIGDIERLDPAIDAFIPRDARIEVLADGFEWSEGPVWRSNGSYLLFSDVPQNTIYKWKDGEGISVFLRPAGHAGNDPPGRELGSNGLTLDANGALVMADHGNRQVARVVEPKFTKVPLATRYQGKRFNSPNDVAFRRNGDLYFTDPPYGLAQLNADPAKELPHNGVYRVDARGAVMLLAQQTFPNGLAFSPDERTLYVANSDPARAVWMAYDVRDDGSVGAGRVFFDATRFVVEERPGLPDGLKVDRQGNLFATGPGGVLVFNAQGKHLGTIRTGQPTANCAFGDDGSTLYITSNHQLLRIRLTTKGISF
jgi:gluconolactonase